MEKAAKLLKWSVMAKHGKTENSFRARLPGISPIFPPMPRNRCVDCPIEFDESFPDRDAVDVGPVFGGTVVYLCEHNANGALGIIINKPTDMTMDVLFERIDSSSRLASRKPAGDRPVMFGGPVQVERGFVLHAPMDAYSSMMQVSDEDGADHFQGYVGSGGGLAKGRPRSW